MSDTHDMTRNPFALVRVGMSTAFRGVSHSDRDMWRMRATRFASLFKPFAKCDIHNIRRSRADRMRMRRVILDNLVDLSGLWHLALE